jgi:Tfp pilus assembly protein PilN
VSLVNPAPPRAAPTGPLRVNLLPDAVRFRNAARARRKLWSVAVATTLLLSGLAFQWTTRASGEIRSGNALLNDVLGQISRERKRLSQLKQRSTSLQEQFSALDSMARRGSWADRLARIAEAVPPEMVLSHLAVAPGGAQQQQAQPPPESGAGSPVAAAQPGQQLRIEGYAREYGAIAEFLRRLRDAGLFERVALTQSAPQPGGRGDLLGFGVSCER